MTMQTRKLDMDSMTTLNCGATTSGEADLKFYLIGRDPNGLREWVQGTAAVALKRVQGEKWLIQRMVMKCVESLVATTDIFSEVSGPAGVSVRFPLLGEKNSRPYSFYWHGAAAVDIDLDGDVDVFATADYRNYLYLNDGTGKFREVSSEASLKNTSSPDTAGGTAPLFVDIDNDGDSDLFLSMWDKQKLFENRLIPDGKLVFRDISEKSGVAVKTNGLTAVSGDINNDGLPDIYVCGMVAWITLKLVSRRFIVPKTAGGTFFSSTRVRDVFARWQRNMVWMIHAGPRPRFENIPAGTYLQITEAQNGFETIVQQRASLPDPGDL